MWTNNIGTRIDKTQQINKCRLCGDGDETIKHIISECSKLTGTEYKTRHDWVGKVIHWEKYKKLKFDHTNKWYMHNPASDQENATHWLLQDFNIETDHLIAAKRGDFIIINKKKRIWKIVDFAVPSDLRVKLKKGLVPRPCLGIENLWNMKVTIIPIVIGALRTVTKWLLKGLEELVVGRRVEFIKNTELLGTARILWRMVETWDLLSLSP